jgi:hypothetical protein
MGSTAARVVTRPGGRRISVPNGANGRNQQPIGASEQAGRWRRRYSVRRVSLTKVSINEGNEPMLRKMLLAAVLWATPYIAHAANGIPTQIHPHTIFANRCSDGQSLWFVSLDSNTLGVRLWQTDDTNRPIPNTSRAGTYFSDGHTITIHVDTLVVTINNSNSGSFVETGTNASGPLSCRGFTQFTDANVTW